MVSLRSQFQLSVVLLACGCIGIGEARAEIIYETDGPFGGPFGLIGYDVCISQSVGLRFTPDDLYRLDRVKLWFMSNDFTGQTHPLVEVSLRPDDDSVPGESFPSQEIIEATSFNVSAVGWNPILETVEFESSPLLEAGVHYWIVTKSDAPCGLDGVWNWAAFGTGFVANTDGTQEVWQAGSNGAVVATIIEATPATLGDFDGDADIDLTDMAAYFDCAQGPGVTGLEPDCVLFDFDGDTDVDFADAAALQLAFTGAR